MPFTDYIAAFDFDGVIWDSVNECYHLARMVFESQGRLLNRPSEELSRQFRAGRYLVKSGEDFYIIMHLLYEGVDLSSDKFDYNTFANLRNELATEMKRFALDFYALRHRLQDDNFEEWASLQSPFLQVVDQVPRIKETFRDMVICTTKDQTSVSRLLLSRGINLPVLGRELSTHKPDQIQHLCRNYNTTPEMILFVDDLLENLAPVRNTGAQVAMASWGYNTPLMRQQALNMGIPLLQKENLLARLKNMTGVSE